MDGDDCSTVAVFGSGEPPEGSAAYATAQAVGRAVAELGYAVANGGYGGTMEASARGAKAAGGRTIGVVCSVWRSAPNAFLDETIGTASLRERLTRLVDLGTGGYVVLPGATGTLAELAMVWELLAKRLLPRRPLVCVGEFWRPLIEMMSAARAACADYVSQVRGPDELKRCLPRRAQRGCT